jgi:hypothetical protein
MPGWPQRPDNHPVDEALDQAVLAMAAVGFGAYASPRWTHLPSPSVPPLDGGAAWTGEATGQTDCGQALGPAELGVVRLPADAFAEPFICCPACALTPHYMPSDCYFCWEPDTYTMAFIHDAGRLITLVSMCTECATYELDDDPDALAWSPARALRQ